MISEMILRRCPTKHFCADRIKLRRSDMDTVVTWTVQCAWDDEEGL